MADKKILEVYVSDFNLSFDCDCGNNAYASSGFDPCDRTGKRMKPDITNNWAGHYICNECGQIYAVKVIKKRGI